MGKPEGRSGWEPVRPLSSQHHICPQTAPLSHHPALHDPDLIYGLILRVGGGRNIMGHYIALFFM